MSGRRDWITDLGIAAVGIAAGILTFTALRDLGQDVGIRGWLAWLVPVTVDAAGVIAARVWLRRTAPAEAVAFARSLAWACIALSVAGNAGQHYMDAFTVAPPWWVVVAVSAVPPAMLGAVVHLGHLTRRPASAGVETGEVPDRTPGPDRTEADRLPVRTTAEAWDLYADDDQAEADRILALVPDRTDRTDTDRRTGPADRTEADRAGPAPDQGGPGERTDDEIVADLARRGGPVPSRNAVMREYSVGTGRADRLLEAARTADRTAVR